MADKCAICGAEVNLFQAQKLADGTAICRKNCRAKGFRCFDYVHAVLPTVKAHLEQVERGTKLWNHYFVPRMAEKDKAKKLQRFAGYLYVAEDLGQHRTKTIFWILHTSCLHLFRHIAQFVLARRQPCVVLIVQSDEKSDCAIHAQSLCGIALGLTAFVQVDYKFFIFGKSYRACVYRTADLVGYEYEEQEVKTNDGTQKKEFIRFSFKGDGLTNFTLPLGNIKEYESIRKYFDTQFGIQKTLGNAANNAQKQVDALKSVAAGIGAVINSSADTQSKIADAAEALDTAVYGDRTELIRRADEALAAFNG